VYSQVTSENNWKIDLEGSEFNISNYRDFLFEVIPKLDCQVRSQLLETIPARKPLFRKQPKQEAEEEEAQE
jgi:hypothetical protein